jgi:hypothetical protein
MIQHPFNKFQVSPSCEMKHQRLANRTAGAEESSASTRSRRKQKSCLAKVPRAYRLQQLPILVTMAGP